MAALDGVEIKMARSMEHITSLREETTQFIEGQGAQYRRVRDEEPPKGWGFYVAWEPVPGRFGAIIGDALTNMRAALDHLASQLFFATKQAPTDAWINFPIASDPAKPLKSLQRVPAAAAPIIASVQPYQNLTRGQPAEIHPLHVLKLLVNRDKHEALTLTELFGASSIIRVTGIGGAPIFASVETPGGLATDPVGWLPDEAFPADEPWEIFATIEPILAIDLGNKRMLPILELLTSMHSYVQGEVIDPIAAACFSSSSLSVQGHASGVLAKEPDQFG
jgi:hypothetical protein